MQGTLNTPTDVELTELAARAAGVEIKMWTPSRQIGAVAPLALIGDALIPWAPLTDGGDGLRLAVKLGFSMNNDYTRKSALVMFDDGKDLRGVCEDHGDDPVAATCRAIVRAAAEIGLAMS